MKTLLRKVPELEYLECYDFTYDLSEPRRFDDSYADVLLVLLNPLVRKDTPRGARDIADRLNEISFNASVVAELRTVAVAQDLVRRGLLKPSGGYQPLRFHTIAADGVLSDLKLSSKANTDWVFLQELKARGRKAAEAWMEKDLALVGERSTFDLSKAFL